MSRAVLEELRLYLEVLSLSLAKSVLRTVNTLPAMYVAGGSVAIPSAMRDRQWKETSKRRPGRVVVWCRARAWQYQVPTPCVEDDREGLRP